MFYSSLLSRVHFRPSREADAVCSEVVWLVSNVVMAIQGSKSITIFVELGKKVKDAHMWTY